jgi:aspartate/methionine/tyrosine aminotransferase
MYFSSITDSMMAPKNPLYELHADLLRQGHAVFDLVRGNVNEHGIVFPPEILADALREAAEPARVYRPDSFGQQPARDAIAAYYDHRIPPSQILVTPGTSVSYWFCFKLLAEPGDEILTPQPSYPLFDYIAQLCGVRLTYYRLNEAQNWAIDLEHLEHQITTRTRAIVLISPHNPTGMVADDATLQGLAEIATRHELPIISDEVFSEFLFDGLTHLPRPAWTQAPLVFTLNGFSKMFALPGFKIGWAAVSGDPTRVSKAMSALEMISDTFLPVNEIAQFAAHQVFTRGHAFVESYKTWIADCRNAALEALAGCSFSRPRGGFYVTVALDTDEESAALQLLRDSHILVHPGYYYDIRPNHLVMTFIEDPSKIPSAFGKIAEVCRV